MGRDSATTLVIGAWSLVIFSVVFCWLTCCDDGSGHDAGTEGEGGFVDVEIGSVQRGKGGQVGGAAESEHDAGDVLEVAGKIFAAHAGAGDELDVVGAEDVFGFLPDEAGEVGVVLDRGDAGGEVDIDLRVGDFFDAAHHLADLLKRARADFGVEGA